MKNIKKVLAMMLTAAMVLTSASFNVSAEETDTGSDATVSESVVEDTDGNDYINPENEEATDETEENNTISESEPETVDESAAESEEEVVPQVDPVKLATASKPSDGTTTGQPFSSGTGGSQNFRIPAMATTSSGEIIAATDARYTGTADGYGLDTMVSYSTDSGSNWHYSYVNYNDDSSGYNGSASAFIDPALAVNGSTVYLFAGLYPGGGVYIGNAKSGTGYTTVNNESVLALYSNTSASSSTTPSYYVSNTANSDGYYPIYKYSDSSATSYYVDGEYDIYTLSNGSYTAVTGTQIDNSSTTINANIFYTGNANKSGMYVLGTYYLTMRKGTINTDGSISWESSLSILNSQVKGSSESFYGIGPAGAIVTSTGRIVLPMYTYNTSTQSDGNASVIYSDNGGTNWTRGASVSDQTSEASVSEVNVNGTNYLYMFVRHGGYYVSSDMGATWSSKKSVSGISYYTGCQLSTLTYSKTIDGYPAIILSVPSNTSGRTNGKIFVGLVQSDGTINWKYNYQVNNSTYQYSDLVELSDGSIGVLYENGDASEYYQTLAISTIANGAKIGTDTSVTYTVSASKTTLAVNGTATLTATASDGSDTSTTTWTSSDTNIVSINGTTATAVASGTAILTATLPDNSTQTVEITVTSADTDKDVKKETVPGSTVYQLDTDGVDSGAEYVIWSATGGRILYNVSGNSTTDQVTGTVSDSDYDSDTTITLASGFDESTQLWTVTKSGDGYTLKGNNSGTYLNLASTTSSKANMNSSATASGSVLTITRSETGNTVSYSYTGTASYTSAGTISYSSNNNYSSYTGGSYYYKNGNSYVAITSLSCTRTKNNNNYNYNYNNNYTYSWTINGSITSSSSSLTYYTKSGGSGKNYLVHSSSSSNQFYTSASTTGNLLYFFKKTTTPDVTTYTADNSKLIELIKTANALTEGDYTAASWADLQTALTVANAIGTPSAQNTESAAQEDQDKINTAAKNLNDAINALVKVQNIIVKVGESKTVENLTGSLNTDSLDTTIATAELVNGTLTVTGVKEGLTSVTVGDQVYNITVKPATVDIKTTPFTSGTTLGASGKVTKLTTSVGLSYDINIDSSVAASGGTWSIADTSIATVDSNGTVTGVAAGETTLTYTVNGETYTIPVVIRADATSTSSVKTYEFYVSEITDTTTYMAICNTTFKDMVEIQEGEAIYLSFATTDNTAIDFFAAPDEGYALTRMSSTNSAGDYMAVQRDVSASETDFYNNGAGASQTESGSIGATVLTQVIEAAQKLGCDGGMGWTRPSTKSDNVTSTLTFRSEKLPTVEKTVKSVGGETYTEGMNAKAGDKIVFTITVTKYACEDSVTYSNASLTDNLSGAVFSGASSATKSITISSGTDAETQTFDVEYTVKDADLDTVITNTVDLKYTYQAEYSSGSFGSTANAAAKVNALSFTPKDIVVDTGLPVTIDYSGSTDHGRYDLSSDGAKATYGTVTVAGNKVTYTPDKVLTDIDTVTITNTKGTEYTFKVYPASTVYYEENFASMTGFAVNGNAENTGTTAQILGSSDAYGYETVYADDGVGASNGTQATSSAKGDRMTLTFKGTGIDVYANCTSDTSKAFVQVLKDGAAQKLAVVDTKTTGIYGIDGESQYSLPIFSISGLPYGTYTVNVTAYTDTAINIDGFRVYNTLNDSTGEDSPYYADKEDGPDFYELRNELTFGSDDVDIEVEGEEDEDSTLDYPQVLGSAEIATGVVLDENGTERSDVLTDGPKNEIFLKSGSTLTFKVNTDKQMQVGLKAVNAATSVTLNGSSEGININSCVDMFYTVTGTPDSYGDQTVTIKNNGDGVLSVTKLKVCDDPDASFVPLSNDDLRDAFTALGLVEAPEAEMADAVCTVNLKDYAGNVIASSDLTANGVVGYMGIFAADDIKAAAESVLPSGYAFVDESAVTDTSIAYGESGSVDIQIGKVATLKITYKKGFKTVGTATLTHIQTSEGSKYTFSTSEIKAAAPSGLRVISLWGTSVNYGSTKSITATGR